MVNSLILRNSGNTYIHYIAREQQRSGQFIIMSRNDIYFGKLSEFVGRNAV